MAEPIACPGCGKRFKFKSELQGKRVKCNACGTAFAVTSSPAAPVVPPPPLPPPVWNAPAVRQMAIPVGYESAMPDGKPLWTPKQKQCRYVGLRLLIFGGAATVLPFFGIQFTVLHWMGGWAVLLGLLLVFAGLALFGGAYLSRTRMFGGPYAAVKIGGLAAGALVVFLIFIFGLLVIVAMIARPRSKAVAATPAPTAKPPAIIAPSGMNAGRPFPSAGVRPTPRPAEPSFDEQHAVHLHITGLNALPANERMPRVGDCVKQLGKTLHTAGYRMQQSGDQLNATISPVDDLQAAARAVTFGTANVDESTRTVNIVLDLTKLPPAPPPPPPKRSSGQPMQDLKDALQP